MGRTLSSCEIGRCHDRARSGEPIGGEGAAERARRDAEHRPEPSAEVTVMGEPQLEREGGKVPLATGETIERHGKPQPEQVTEESTRRSRSGTAAPSARGEMKTSRAIWSSRHRSAGRLARRTRVRSTVLRRVWPSAPRPGSSRRGSPRRTDRRRSSPSSSAASGSTAPSRRAARAPCSLDRTSGSTRPTIPTNSVRADGVLSALRRKCEDDALVALGAVTDPVVIPGAEDDRARGSATVTSRPRWTSKQPRRGRKTCVVSVCSSSAGADSLARHVTS